jgi:hypothetical protein
MNGILLDVATLPYPRPVYTTTPTLTTFVAITPSTCHHCRLPVLSGPCTGCTLGLATFSAASPSHLGIMFSLGPPVTPPLAKFRQVYITPCQLPRRLHSRHPMFGVYCRNTTHSLHILTNMLKRTIIQVGWTTRYDN